MSAVHAWVGVWFKKKNKQKKNFYIADWKALDWPDFL